jgi:hypothetical protein
MHWVHSLGSLADEARLANSVLKQRGELGEKKEKRKKFLVLSFSNLTPYSILLDLKQVQILLDHNRTCK